MKSLSNIRKSKKELTAVQMLAAKFDSRHLTGEIPPEIARTPPPQQQEVPQQQEAPPPVPTQLLPLFGFENNVTVEIDGKQLQRGGFLCYLLATLQVILRLPKMKDYLYLVSDTIIQAKEIPNPQVKLSLRAGIFFQQLAQLLHAIRNNETKGYNSYQLNSFIKFFYSYMQDFEFGEQQDAHECFNSILNDFMDDFSFEINARFKIDTSVIIRPLPFFPQGHIMAATAAYLNKSFVRQLVGGIKKCTLDCQKCGHISEKAEQFTELLVNIPHEQQKTEKKETNKVTLEECIRSHFVIEHMKGDEKWYCPECKEKVEALKSEEMVVLPNVFIIGLKRFQTANQADFREPQNLQETVARFRARNKDQSEIDIPLNNLDLTPFVNPTNVTNTVDVSYECIGIISHLGGNRNHGHYVAYIRVNDEWYLMNDEYVFKWLDKTSNGRIISSDAYLLVFKKKSFD